MKTDYTVCENCKHFEKHYTWIDGHFYAIRCGHCNLGLNIKNKFKEGLCVKWESGAEKSKKRKNSIKEELLRMAVKVNDIALLLEIEKDNDN